MDDEITRARLERLPIAPDRTLEGDVRAIAALVDTGGMPAHPSVALWADSDSGHVRAHRVFVPSDKPGEDVSEAIRALLDALVNPSPTSGMPALYGIVRVSRPDLADAARSILPERVTVEVVDSVPEAEDALRSLEDYLAQQMSPFSWEGDPALFQRLFNAAGTYARRAPWTYLADNPPLVVSLPPSAGKRRGRTLYGCVLGGAGMVRGIAFYLTRAGFERTMAAGDRLLVSDEMTMDIVTSRLTPLLEQAGVSADSAEAEDLVMAAEEMVRAAAGAGAPPEDSLALFFLEEDEEDPTYLRWIEERGLKVDDRGGVPEFMRVLRGGETRMPNAEETYVLTLAIEAVNDFLTRYRRRLTDPLKAYEPVAAHITLSGGEVAEVRWPGI